jgi:hypothetical protein
MNSLFYKSFKKQEIDTFERNLEKILDNLINSDKSAE